MNEARLRKLLEEVRSGQVGLDQAVETLRLLPCEDLGFAMVDTHRELRTGFPEVIYCPGKTVEQVVAIARRLTEHGQTVLATRVEPEVRSALAEAFPGARHLEQARMVVVPGPHQPEPAGWVGVICAGTADIPVAEEAAATAEAMGRQVDRIYDVGVAGLHRLLHHREKLQRAGAIVVVAGMEGALASVVGGLVRCPVVAVPTSVGYGASFGGLAPLLTMLNSCSAGVAVVNIDNGFGAGYFAGLVAAPRKDEG